MTTYVRIFQFFEKIIILVQYINNYEKEIQVFQL